MIKSAMRAALKDSLLGLKNGSRNERARRYVKKDEDSRDEKMIQGSEKGLRSKVDDAEEDAFDDLEASSPSEHEGSDEEEMSESAAEAKSEGDPESWREDQKKFMKGKSTAKKPKKSASFFGKGNIGKLRAGGGKGLSNKKIDPPFQPRSVKGQAQQTIG